MSVHHLVRIGVLGQVGRFRAVDMTSYSRETRVVCRTRRGLEIGEVLTTEKKQSIPNSDDGYLLRRVTIEDDLLIARLEKNRLAAIDACNKKLEQHNLMATLLDVDHLFDGQSLYFYFLGPVTNELENITQELAETYEKKVQFRRFTENVIAGCGPECGTDAAAGGCGSSCSTCAISGACATK